VLSGFADGDRIDELLRRVYELPPELDDMFKMMLSRVNERHREQGAFTLRTCHAVSVSGGVISKYQLGLKSVPIALLCREGADPEVLEEDDKEELREGLTSWLASRCGGLLATNLDSRQDQVVWVHRSAVEFLSADGTWDLECLRVDEDRPGLLAAVSVYVLHSLMQDNHDAQIVYNWWYSAALVAGARADAEEPEKKDHSFWHIDSYLDWMRQVEPMPPGTGSQVPLKRLLVRHSDASQAVSHAALLLAAESGAVNYVKAHPDFAEFCKLGGRISCGCLPLFYHAAAHPLNCTVMVSNQPGPPSAVRTTISFFLSMGVDPNMTVAQRVAGSDGERTCLDTPWRGWLSWSQYTRQDPDDLAAAADITAMFLAAGADPTVKVAAWILPYLVDQKNRDTLTVSDAQLASAVTALQGEILQVGQNEKKEGKEVDGRLWVDDDTRNDARWRGVPCSVV
jgi:hypothetical protein